jgi:hypothetical protein
VTAKVHVDEPEMSGEGRLLAEEAAMGHEAVKKHERRAFTFVAVADPRPVRGGKMVQMILPRPRPFKGLSASRLCTEVKPESMFNLADLALI